MTANELRNKFNNEFGLSEWPKTYEVDAETYGNVCQCIFDYLIEIEAQIKVIGDAIGIPV